MKRFKIWNAISARAFTADGTATGKITIASTFGFYVSQHVVVKATSLPDKFLEIKQILSVTEMIVGPRDGTARYSAVDFYTVALNATVEAPEQSYGVDAENGDVLAAVYENHPIAAIRSILVDGLGQFYTEENPLPVNAAVSIGDVNVQLTHQDNSPNPGDVHDSIRIGDGTNEAIVNADGSFDVNQLNSLMDGVRFDSIKVVSKTFDGPTLVEYYSGGLSGALQASISIVYDVDGDIVSVVRT